VAAALFPLSSSVQNQPTRFFSILIFAGIFKDELALTRENHAAVMRELKRMRDEPGYVSAWEPKTALNVEHAAPAAGMRPR
jgi:hypothetical protein